MKEFMLFACGFGFGLALLALPIVALSFIFPAFWLFAVGVGLGALGVLPKKLTTFRIWRWATK